ncbi:hypothetical protein G7Y89_g15416 [Cudoniella acicularis]|uniref:Peroxin-14 n=1 Tax=Cudoniella acicularis TaxID=354080 RepID=A0A8H4QNY7_9HELO|nr:hypothetical protein G7Y89_g15416 [Cudoniella acicularis]
MLATLTTSRLELAETASSDLQKLIAKLESMVSTIPNYVPKHHVQNKEEEVESEDEDPTELFHRDIGVQTSPPRSTNASRSGSPSPGPERVLNDQVTRLTGLSKSITELVADSTSEGENTNELETTISVFREYLDSMAYVAPNYGFSGGYGGHSGSGGVNNGERMRMMRLRG